MEFKCNHAFIMFYECILFLQFCKYFQDGSTSNNTCYEGRTPDTGEITDDIKEECGDLEVQFIKASECPKGSLINYVKMRT